MNKSNGSIKLRSISQSDLYLLFNWANDEEVRQNAIDVKLISLDRHTEWFQKIMTSGTSNIFILEVDDTPAGQVRFDYNSDDDVWEIDYSVEKKSRGMGLAKTLLQEGIIKLNRLPVVGYVRKSNTRSQSVFNALFFFNEGVVSKNGVEVIKYVLNK